MKRRILIFENLRELIGSKYQLMRSFLRGIRRKASPIDVLQIETRRMRGKHSGRLVNGDSCADLFGFSLVF